MAPLVRSFNGVVTGLFDLLFLPFRGFRPIWALLAVSLLAGALMLWIFGRVSDQEAVRRVRERIRGNLIGIRLFGDDVYLLFLLLGRVLRSTATYLRHSLVPMLVMLVPVLVILIQLDLRFSRRPLEPGVQALVKVGLRGTPAAAGEIDLEAPAGIVVETPALRVEALREVAWRIRAERPGGYRLQVRAGDERVEKQLVVGSGWGVVSAVRTGQGALQMLLHPGEPPIAGSSRIASIELTYPALKLRLWGFGLDWLVVFFVASVAAGFALRPLFGVEI